jgi:error-prone DNA polymerase
MLSLVQEACELVEKNHGQEILLDRLPHDDPEVYDMICASDTVGVFQVESRAQMQTLPQTQPRSIDDLTVEVAIIRPGPLQGNMVHPYIRRRKGLEKVTYPHPTLKPILAETLGVILFQEQVLQVATAIAGFTSGEADSLRRAMSRKRSHRAMEQLRQRFVDGAKDNRISEQTADRIFEILKGFAAFGFCKSHAAGFALLSYESAWLKRHYPAEFYAALLSNQPMGFYAPDIIVNDAKRHGVTLLPIDINRSEGRCAVEASAVRLGFMYVKELGTKAITQILAARQSAPFKSLEDFCYRASIETSALENLTMVGAFDAFGLTKRQSLWQLGLLEKTGPEQLPLGLTHTDVSLPALTEMEEMRAEYQTQGLSTKHHPMQVLRKQRPEIMTLTSAEVSQLEEGSPVRFAGYVATRQRPGTAKGFCFLTLEDDEGMVNVILRPKVYEEHRQIFKLAPVIVVEGVIQKRDGITNVIAERLSPSR